MEPGHGINWRACDVRRQLEKSSDALCCSLAMTSRDNTADSAGALTSRRGDDGNLEASATITCQTETTQRMRPALCSTIDI